MLKFLIIGALVIVGVLYSIGLLNYPSGNTQQIPVSQQQQDEEQPQPVQRDDNNIQLSPNDNLAITLPADENSTISTEIEGAGGIAGVGKGPLVVNITTKDESIK